MELRGREQYHCQSYALSRDLDHAKAIAPLPCLARKTRTAIEGRKLSALARKSFSCLKSRMHWAVGNGGYALDYHDDTHDLHGTQGVRRAEAKAIGPANLTSTPAMNRVDNTDHSVGAKASTFRSARTRHDVTPNSPRAQTMVKTVGLPRRRQNHAG